MIFTIYCVCGPRSDASALKALCSLLRFVPGWRPTNKNRPPTKTSPTKNRHNKTQLQNKRKTKQKRAQTKPGPKQPKQTPRQTKTQARQKPRPNKIRQQNPPTPKQFKKRIKDKEIEMKIRPGGPIFHFDFRCHGIAAASYLGSPSSMAELLSLYQMAPLCENGTEHT